ncbi:carbonic anhydrase [Amphritea sp. HPY]|uniref:carbonic anhydrase n=1 Tax=Amphritea sp. HPY TaxID=3421652 RepID=UPI003D7CE4F2
MCNKCNDFFSKNKIWASKINENDPSFFEKLSKLHDPDYLWIGCSDSRVPVNEMFDVLPGEIFVHRNIANQVIESDMNFLSVLEYAVDVLKVKNIMVVGHYECGGVSAAINRRRETVVDYWVHNIVDIIDNIDRNLIAKFNDQELHDYICEMNVIQQVKNLSRTTVVKDAQARGEELNIHGWIYNVRNGLLKDITP